jgi:hypothetical protein
MPRRLYRLPLRVFSSISQRLGGEVLADGGHLQVRCCRRGIDADMRIASWLDCLWRGTQGGSTSSW